MLRNWTVVPLFTGRGSPFVLVGIVLADRKGRFRDGTKIATTPVRTPLEQVRSGAIVSTLNSRYLLLPFPETSDSEMLEELCLQ
jgi:hypothetical protein